MAHIAGEAGRSRQSQKAAGRISKRDETGRLSRYRRLCRPSKAKQPAARFRSAIWREFLRQRLPARAPRLVEHVKKVKQHCAGKRAAVLEWWVGKGREQA